MAEIKYQAQFTNVQIREVIFAIIKKFKEINIPAEKEKKPSS